MTLGQRIYQARTEAGLSQRQLAGDEMTRNMLSLLEHDEAKPSLSSLQYLAQRLGRPMSYLLGEDRLEIPEYPLVIQARNAMDQKDYRKCLEILDQLNPVGEIFAREVPLLRMEALLGLAQQALTEHREPYGRTLLLRAEELLTQEPWLEPMAARRIRILRALCPEKETDLKQLVKEIPDDDQVLLLRSKGAVLENRFADARRYLAAVEDRTTPQWNFLMGETLFGEKRYQEALQYFHCAEKQMPIQCREKLEICYRETENYKMAYYYAKK